MLELCPLCGCPDAEELWVLPESPLFHVIAQDGPTDECRLFASLRIVACRECGHVFNRDYNAELWTDMYTGSILTNRPVTPEMFDRLDRLITWIEPENLDGKRLLEIGSGTGHLARLFARHCKDVVVYEPSAGLTRELLPEENITLFNTGFTAEFADGKVDTIVCRQVLEHLTEPAGMIKDIAATLEDGGLLYLEVPSCDFIRRAGAFCDFHNGHVQYFTRAKLVDLCSRHGLLAEKEQEIMAGHDIGVLFRKAESVNDMLRPDTVMDIKSWCDQLQKKRSELTQMIESCRGRIFLYGATWHCASFLNACCPERPVEAVLDDNPDNRGCVVYSRSARVGIRPYKPGMLEPEDTVFICAYIHSAVIERKLLESGFQGNVHTIH